jgi:RHS repeat-associated protein
MYTGTYKDHMLGFYQMGARYYSPGMGRFTQVDPLGRSVYEANRYWYADCNPANATDPTGLLTSCQWSWISAAFTIAADILLLLPFAGSQIAAVLLSIPSIAISGVQLVNQISTDFWSANTLWSAVGFVASFPFPGWVGWVTDAISISITAIQCGPPWEVF